MTHQLSGGVRTTGTGNASWGVRLGVFVRHRVLRGTNFLWASLVLVPVDIVARIAGMGHVGLFVLSVLALIPLAWIIGEATEQIGEFTGPAIAGLLNATFGNAPELIISLFAVSGGLFDVVRGSLAGSVIGNLLLVLGCSLVAGGRGKINRGTAYSTLSMVAVSIGLFAVATAATGSDSGPGSGVPVVSVVVAGALFATYILVTVRAVRQEHRKHKEEGGHAEPDWSLTRGLVTLGLATLATVAVSEVLTGSVEAFGQAAGLSDAFVAAVIVAIAGNAAEHGGAVVIAARGNVLLASEIGLQSAAQVATGLIPAVVLLSLAFNPMALVFSPVEFLGMAVATAVPALLLIRGRSSRQRGIVLCVTYAAVVAAFYALAG